MHEAARRSFGDDAAATLMEHLPPVGWADVVTKQDLEHQRIAMSKDMELLRASTTKDMELVRAAMAKDLSEGLRGLERRMDSHFRATVGVLVTTLVVVIGALASLA